MNISVIVGILNKNPDTSQLTRALTSILRQSLTSFELLINDDGSCPEVITVLDKLAREDRRIRLLREGNRFTLPQKLNWCLRFSHGSYIARMDDDDYALPDRFAKQAAFLESHKEISFVGSNVLRVREGIPAEIRILPEYPTKEDFKFVLPYVHPALMFRKTVLDIAGGYSERKRQNLCEDYDLLLRLYEKGFKGSNLQEVLLEYSVPPLGKSNRRYRHRINEAVTRWQRFKSLDMLPRAFPYVIKPLAVGLIPPSILDRMKAGSIK